MISFVMMIVIRTQILAPNRSPRVAQLRCSATKPTFLAEIPGAATALTIKERLTAGALQRRLDLSDAQMVRLLVRHPAILGLSFEANLAPTLDALQRSLRLTDPDLSKVVRSRRLC